MVSMLIALLVLAVVAYIVWKIMGLIPMDGTLKQILFLIFSLIIFLAVLDIFGVYDSGLNFRTN